jgi:hypothetical protein
MREILKSKSQTLEKLEILVFYNNVNIQEVQKWQHHFWNPCEKLDKL